MNQTSKLSLFGGFLKYDGENNEFRYLGYLLPLTKTEAKILLRLMRRPDGYCTANDLGDILKESADPEGLLRAHVSHINDKAFAIGERRLIECRKNVGYKISFSL